MCGRVACMSPPPRQILRDTVNERAVRILLECILVELAFHSAGFSTDLELVSLF